ncbi:unannotated protein [freshwater metagenome]|uniref:Unannotated protein n=1 Tax=freshwater metagenome TaxID=449393 RepID=A0A6J7L1N2_9ZZZZ
MEPLQIQLLRRWDPFAMPGDEEAPDPWNQQVIAYREMFDLFERTMPALLNHLEWLHAEPEH